MGTRSQEQAPLKLYQSRDWLLKGTFKSEVVAVHPQLAGTPEDFPASVRTQLSVSAQQELSVLQNRVNRRTSHPWQVADSYTSKLIQQKVSGRKPWERLTKGSYSMAWMKRPSHLTKLAVALGLGLVINVPVGLQLIQPVKAQLMNGSLNRNLPGSWNFDPPKRGNPDNREGGATRGPDCGIPQGKKLTLLGPKWEAEPKSKSDGSSKSGISTTLAAYPTFYWYVPETTAKSMKFELKEVVGNPENSDENSGRIYTADFVITGNSGIVSLKLPPFSALSPLEIGKEYSWEVTLICGDDPKDPETLIENIISVAGLIKRVPSDPVLASKISTARPEERVALYAKARIWHETVATLAELRRSRPYDPTLKTAWEQLLKSAGLGAVAQEPMLQLQSQNTANSR